MSIAINKEQYLKIVGLSMHESLFSREEDFGEFRKCQNRLLEVL